MSNHPTGLDRPIPDRLPDSIELPEAVFHSNKACAEYIVELNERLATVRAVEKLLKEANEAAKNILLERLDVEGMKHFAFDDLGTFSKSEKTYISFPTNENGGKAAAAKWLHACVDAGIMEFEELLQVQQSRISNDTVMSLEQAVEAYNEANPKNPLPASPFHRFEKFTLSTPTKRKG